MKQSGVAIVDTGRSFVGMILAVVLFFVSTAVSAAEPWIRQPNELPTQVPGKIEVVEFFTYNCPHCYALEPSLAAWQAKAPADVAFRRVPAVWDEASLSYARVYATLQALKLERLHIAVFEAVQTGNLQLQDEPSLAAWLKQQQVNAKNFLAVYRSFGVQTAAKQAQQLTRDQRITSVPTVIVDGKFQTSPAIAGSKASFYEALNTLIKQQREK